MSNGVAHRALFSQESTTLYIRWALTRTSIGTSLSTHVMRSGP